MKLMSYRVPEEEVRKRIESDYKDMKGLLICMCIEITCRYIISMFVDSYKAPCLYTCLQATPFTDSPLNRAVIVSLSCVPVQTSIPTPSI